MRRRSRPRSTTASRRSIPIEPSLPSSSARSRPTRCMLASSEPFAAMRVLARHATVSGASGTSAPCAPARRDRAAWTSRRAEQREAGEAQARVDGVAPASRLLVEHEQALIERARVDAEHQARCDAGARNALDLYERERVSQRVERPVLRAVVHHDDLERRVGGVEELAHRSHDLVLLVSHRHDDAERRRELRLRDRVELDECLPVVRPRSRDPGDRDHRARHDVQRDQVDEQRDVDVGERAVESVHAASPSGRALVSSSAETSARASRARSAAKRSSLMVARWRAASPLGAGEPECLGGVRAHPPGPVRQRSLELGHARAGREAGQPACRLGPDPPGVVGERLDEQGHDLVHGRSVRGRGRPAGAPPRLRPAGARRAR